MEKARFSKGYGRRGARAGRGYMMSKDRAGESPRNEDITLPVELLGREKAGID
jgi:hypothetical protein